MRSPKDRSPKVFLNDSKWSQTSQSSEAQSARHLFPVARAIYSLCETPSQHTVRWKATAYATRVSTSPKTNKQPTFQVRAKIEYHETPPLLNLKRAPARLSQTTQGDGGGPNRPRT